MIFWSKFVQRSLETGQGWTSLCCTWDGIPQADSAWKERVSIRVNRRGTTKNHGFLSPTLPLS